MNFRPIQYEHQKNWTTPKGVPVEPLKNEHGEKLCLMCDNQASKQLAEHGLYLCVRCLDFTQNIAAYVERDGFGFKTWGVKKQGEKSIIKKKTVPKSLRQKVLERDNHECLCCGGKENLTIDHIIPQHYVCMNELDNLQTLCKPCNSKKGIYIFNYLKKRVGQ